MRVFSISPINGLLQQQSGTGLLVNLIDSASIQVSKWMRSQPWTTATLRRQCTGACNFQQLILPVVFFIQQLSDCLERLVPRLFTMSIMISTNTVQDQGKIYRLLSVAFFDVI